MLLTLVNTHMGLDVSQQDIKQIYNRLKSSAKQRGIHFDLTLSDLNNLTFPINCPVLSIPLQSNFGKSAANSISIDRIDSTKGYTIDNIVVISNRANKLKSDATMYELQRIYEFFCQEN